MFTGNSGSDSEFDNFQTSFDPYKKPASRKPVTSMVDDSIQEDGDGEELTEDGSDGETDSETEDEDQVDRAKVKKIDSTPQMSEDEYEIPVRSKASKVVDQSALSEEHSASGEEEEEEDSPFKLSPVKVKAKHQSHSRKADLPNIGKKSLVRFGTDEDESEGRSSEAELHGKSEVRKRIKTPARKKKVASSEENSLAGTESEAQSSEPDVAHKPNVKKKNKTPARKSRVTSSEENSGADTLSSDESPVVHHSKKKIKSKKPSLESSDEEEQMPVAKSSQRKTHKRQPKAIESSEEEESPQTLKKPQSKSRAIQDSDEEDNCLEATIPISTPVTSKPPRRSKTPLLNLSVTDSETQEESYHVKRGEMETSEEESKEHETEESYILLKAKKTGKSLISSEAEDSPLKPTTKRKGKMVIRSSGENSAATSEAEVGASMESSVDSARSPSPYDPSPKSTKTRSAKKSSKNRKALDSSDEMESPKSVRSERHIESDNTEEEGGPITPATLVKATEVFDSDEAEAEEESGFKSRYNQDKSRASQVQNQLMKTSVERQDSGNDSSMDQSSKVLNF